MTRPGVQIWTGNPLRKGDPRRELNPFANWFASTSIFRKGAPVFCSLERHELIPTGCPTPEYASSQRAESKPEDATGKISEVDDSACSSIATTLHSG